MDLAKGSCRRWVAEPNQRSSVLSRFNCSHLQAHQALMLAMQRSKRETIKGASAGLPLQWHCMSSANKWWRNWCWLNSSETSLAYWLKIMGPSTDTCRTPKCRADSSDLTFLERILWLLLLRKSATHPRAFPLYSEPRAFITSMRTGWSTVSKAADRSNNIRAPTRPWSQLVDDSDHVIENADDGCLSRVIRAVGRLKLGFKPSWWRVELRLFGWWLRQYSHHLIGGRRWQPGQTTVRRRRDGWYLATARWKLMCECDRSFPRSTVQLRGVAESLMFTGKNSA